MSTTTVPTTAEHSLSGAALVRLVAVCGLAITFDGYDLVVYGTTIPALMDEWGLSPAEAGTIASYALMGMLVGALLVGSIADQVGRRKALIGSVVLFSLCMIVCAIAPNPAVFGLARFVGGLGLGGCMPTAAAVIVEYAPKEKRSLTYVISQSGFAVGGILAAGLAIPLLPALGWRAMYLIGAAPLVIVVLPALKYLPESLEYLVAKGRTAAAASLAGRLGVAVPPSPATGTDRRTGPQRLFQTGYQLPTLLFWAATFCALLLVYGLNTWLPQLMREAGYPLGSALSFLLVFNLGSIIGSLIAGPIADRIGSKPVIAVSFGLAAVCAVWLSFSPSVIPLYILLAIGGHGAIGTQNLINPFVTGYYPAAVRSTGIGWSLGIGRFGAILGPLVGGWILSSSLGLDWNFYFFGLIALIGALLVSLVPQRPTA
ncbi:MAG: MFS transporter [Janibacter sp.]